MCKIWKRDYSQRCYTILLKQPPILHNQDNKQNVIIETENVTEKKKQNFII